MSDIAFLLLIYFLITTTIGEDKGLLVKMPEWSPEITEPLPVLQRNILPVSINADNHLMVEGEIISIDKLKDITKNFFSNPLADSNMAEKPSMAVISLRNDRGTSYQCYISVYNELKAAYNELWAEQALKMYGKKWELLTPGQQKSIRDRIPLVISEAEPTEFGREY